MNLLDVLIIAVVLGGTAGVVLVRAIAQLVEYRTQRRVARLLERNAELFEREGSPWETRR
jgi:hypothetical protein